MALQDKVAQAWVNSSGRAIPTSRGSVEPYTIENAQSMVFDTVSQSVALRDDKLVSLLPAPAGWGGGPVAVGCAGGR
jgi:hypothetical protein